MGARVFLDSAAKAKAFVSSVGMQTRFENAGGSVNGVSNPFVVLCQDKVATCNRNCRSKMGKRVNNVFPEEILHRSHCHGRS